MSEPHPPKSAKLVVSLFMKEKKWLGPVAQKLQQAFGPVDLVGPWFDFNLTDYYRSEMGAPLHRRMLAFKDLIEQERLAEIKHRTNRIEDHFGGDAGRRINIDPGYMVHERFVLASAKNFSHRIYIGRGIYADLTLVYTKGAFQSLPWTYPDYKDTKMTLFLNRIRNKYITDYHHYHRCGMKAGELLQESAGVAPVDRKARDH